MAQDVGDERGFRVSPAPLGVGDDVNPIVQIDGEVAGLSTIERLMSHLHQ